MDKVAIYARVSTEDKQFYDRQVSDLTKDILTHGYKDNQISIYAEKISGYKKERPELNKLLVEVDNYKCIYVTEISRLGRNPKHTREIVDTLIEKKIPIYIKSIGQFTINPDGKRNSIMSIILQVLMEFAHQEAETMKERMKSGKLEKITKQGIVPTSNPAYGYKNVDKKLVIDEEEAEVVKMIYKMALDGNGSYVIAQKLNQMNIPTRLNKTHKNKGVKMRNTEMKMDASKIQWNDVTVRQILKNPIYIGNGIFRGVIYKAPQLIKEEVQKQCIETISNRSTKNDTLYTYLLKNLIYCGICGGKYIGVYQPTKKGSKVYKCLCNKVRMECKNLPINLSLVETLFYDIFISTDLTQFVSNPNDIKKTLEKELDNISTELISLKINLNEKENEEKRILKLIISGKHNEDLLNQLDEDNKMEINTLKKNIGIKKKKELELKQSLLNYNENFNSVDLIKNAKENRIELRNIFRQLISKIIINKLNDGYALLTFYPKLNGVDIKQPVNLIVDIKSVRKNPHTGERKYRYISNLNISIIPIIKNGITINLKEIIGQALYVISIANKQSLTTTQLPYQFKIVDKENYIYMDEKIDA